MYTSVENVSKIIKLRGNEEGHDRLSGLNRYSSRPFFFLLSLSLQFFCTYT